MTYKASVSLATIALVCYGQLSLMLLPIVPLQAASLLNNQNAPAAGADRDDHDACAGYRSQFSTMQTGSVATNGAKTFSNGIRIIGEFTQPAGVDRVSVERALGVPSAVEALTEGGTKLVYKLDGCVGEIVLDQSGHVRNAVFAPSPKPVNQRPVMQERTQPLIEQPRRIVPGTPVQLPEIHKSRHGHAKAIIISTFVLAGVGAAVYYGRKSSSGNCNVPTDRASDGSLCGNRAASVRPGGRP